MLASFQPGLASGFILVALALVACMAVTGLVAALVAPRKLRRLLSWKPSLTTLAAGALLGGGTLWQAAEAVAEFRSALDVAQLDAALRVRHFPEGGLVTTAPPDPRYNCHGWTFADGQRNLSDLDVETILDSGHYCSVPEAASGDIVVYRTAGGGIVHTGVVHHADAGRVYVESKWGSLSRFIHPAQPQDYEGRPSYYRTADTRLVR